MPPPYDSDWTDNYELGAKTIQFGGKLRINGAAYAFDWKDHQQALQSACGINNATTISFIVNVGRVRSHSGELEIMAIPLAGLYIQAGGSFTNATYRGEVPNLLLPAGSSVLDVPRWTRNMRAIRAFAISEALGDSLFLAGRYVGRSDSGFGEGEVLPRRAYTLVDESAGVKRRGGSTLDLLVNRSSTSFPCSGRSSRRHRATPPRPAISHTRWVRPRTIGLRFARAFQADECDGCPPDLQRMTRRWHCQPRAVRPDLVAIGRHDRNGRADRQSCPAGRRECRILYWSL